MQNIFKLQHRNNLMPSEFRYKVNNYSVSNSTPLWDLDFSFLQDGFVFKRYAKTATC